MTAPPPQLPGFGSALQIRGVVDAVAAQLREAIFAGTLPPGAAVTEALVASEFGIARPSAKAAIEKVTAEGLLQRTANRSARVLTIDTEDVHDIYQARRRLESAALRDLASTLHAPERARIANEHIRALRAEHPSEIIDHDLEFHLAIIDALDSARMSASYRRILSEVRLCMAQVQGRQLLHPDLIGDEHSRILAALQLGDAESACEHLTTHLGRAESLLVESLTHEE
ncbi:GntR family transcriptional regulator [Leucobacter sp. NPDC015123]|uniref:GntR family transcriptional regulator n=1 Tax=Leucobacter sp. NPDC015123 TaxID=3364129 RepID=UPI0036F4A56F